MAERRETVGHAIKSACENKIWLVESGSDTPIECMPDDKRLQDTPILKRHVQRKWIEDGFLCIVYED